MGRGRESRAVEVARTHVEAWSNHDFDTAREIAAMGDASSAMLMLTVEADFGGQKVTAPAARLYLLDGEDKIKAEQVTFFALS